MTDDLRCVHCQEVVTVDKSGVVKGFHKELTCHKSPSRVHEISTKVSHPLYPERSTQSITIRGTTMPGWFTGEACIWTGGSSPRCIGPFDDITEAMKYAETRHPGSQFFPYNKPGEITV